MYTLPQEIEVWYVIPAIRREIASCLVKTYGLTYEKVGQILGITKAAVSQYIKGNRAAKIKLPKEVNAKIKSSCKSLSKFNSTSTKEIIKLLDFMKSKKLSCQVCGKIKNGILEDCKEIKITPKY